MPITTEGSTYILVIEDNQWVREFLADQLGNRGYKVMTADNGAEAIECVQNSKFHLVISDLRMPGMNGIETLEAIKKIHPEVPVIMASGFATDEEAATAIKKGAYHFLQKPIAMGELFRMIEKALEKKDPKNLETLLETAMDRMLKLTHADEGSFMLVDKENQLYIACSRGLSEEAVYTTALKIGERVAGLAAREGHEFLIKGGLDKYPEFRGIENRPRIRSSIVIPIHHEGKLLGILNLNRTKTDKAFTKKDLLGVSAFVLQIGQSVQQAKCEHDLEASSRHSIKLSTAN